ncbi:MAG TPA: recombinase family protein [Dehalococcoidia bacterium]|nr:recombinase family protein [Dehalococcoidia bacterium]
MVSVPCTDANRVALVGRVSSEDQAERGTIEAQLHFLRQFADLYKLDVVGEYFDDGISGTIPLADRPEGRRLAGKWTGGPVPFGYDVDQDGALILSERPVPGLNLTEAEVARSVFENIAAGSTSIRECFRLNALKVPTARRYSTGREVVVGETWGTSRLNVMLHNTVYVGEHVLKTKNGPIVRAVPALVDRATWERAVAQLRHNRTLKPAAETQRYLLRGLIRCATPVDPADPTRGACGYTYSGAATSNKGRSWRY